METGATNVWGFNRSVNYSTPASAADYGAAGRTGSPAYLLVLLAGLMILLDVVIVAGNALVIMAFAVDKTLRNQSNFFFLNLAVSDFLVGAFCIPVYIPYTLTGHWTLGRGLCKLWLVMDYLICTASVYNIVLISYDRFLSVTRAVKYRAQRNMTRQAVVKMVAVWMLAFLLYGPAIIFWELIAGQSVVPEEECFADFYFTWYFLLSASTFEFFSPFFSVAFFNLCIYVNIHRRNKSRPKAICSEDPARASRERGTPQDSETPQGKDTWSVFFVKTRKVSSSEKKAAISARIEVEDDELQSPSSSGDPNICQAFLQKNDISPGRKSSRICRPKAPCGATTRRTKKSRLSRDKKIAKSLAILVCIFGICWAPYTLLMIIRAACRGTCVAHFWYEITFWLLWLNSAINPFLYPLCHSSFRRAFAKILCPIRKSLQTHSDTRSS